MPPELHGRSGVTVEHHQLGCYPQAVGQNAAISALLGQRRSRSRHGQRFLQIATGLRGLGKIAQRGSLARPVAKLPVQLQGFVQVLRRERVVALLGA